MTIADEFRKIPQRGRTNWRRFFHVLVFLPLIGLHGHGAFETGPQHGVDGTWYIGYALSGDVLAQQCVACDPFLLRGR